MKNLIKAFIAKNHGWLIDKEIVSYKNTPNGGVIVNVASNATRSGVEEIFISNNEFLVFLFERKGK